MIIFIHGFRSAPTKERYIELKDINQDVLMVQMDYTDPIGSLDMLRNIVKKHREENDLILMGLSLGGFFAKIVGSIHNVKTVLINPCLNPEEVLKFANGEDLPNYKTRKYERFSEDFSNILRQIKEDHENIPSPPIKVFINLHDEFLNSNETIEYMKERNHSYRVFYIGGHQFSHWKKIKEDVQEFANKIICF